jgi:hypothetical protein
VHGYVKKLCSEDIGYWVFPYMKYIYIEFYPQEPARELKDQFSIILVVHQFRSPVILQRSINLLIYHTTVVLLRHPNAAAAAVLGS